MGSTYSKTPHWWNDGEKLNLTLTHRAIEET